MDENLETKAIEVIQEIYRKTLLDKAINCIQNAYPNTGEFILVKVESDCVVVGYLSYYTEEAILTEYSEQLGLTEDDIGEPCEYWETVLSIEPDGSLIECQSGNNNPWEHPEWQRIINSDKT